MTLKIKILRRGLPDIELDVPINAGQELTKEQLFGLWQAEKNLNDLPANLRVHINLAP